MKMHSRSFPFNSIGLYFQLSCALFFGTFFISQKTKYRQQQKTCGTKRLRTARKEMQIANERGFEAMRMTEEKIVKNKNNYNYVIIARAFDCFSISIKWARLCSPLVENSNYFLIHPNSNNVITIIRIRHWQAKHTNSWISDNEDKLLIIFYSKCNLNLKRNSK